MKKYNLVPQEDIDALEVARVRLQKYLRLIKIEVAAIAVSDMTTAAHILTHKKYGKAYDLSEPDETELTLDNVGK